MPLHRMAPVDAAWFHMDGQANLAMVTSVVITRAPLDFTKAKALYSHRLQAFPRFRQRVVEHGLPVPSPHWQDMDDFDIARHLHHVALPEPGDRAALAELLGDIASTPLDPRLPLWQVHVIDGVEGGSALVTRFHHCIGDGTAMTALALRLYDTTGDAPIERPDFAEPLQLQDDAAAGWVEAAVGAIVRSTYALVSATDAVVETVSNPLPVVERIAAVVGGTGMLLGELMKDDDPPSPFKGVVSQGKRVAWSAPVSIADVKGIGTLADAKVNDVLVAAMTGALRGYLLDRGVDVAHTTLRALVPVDLRPPERALELGNDFGLVLLDLPVAAATPLERLRATKAAMDALKHSAEPVAMRALFEFFGRTPKQVSDIPQSLISGKASLVMTNVMGPTQPLYVAGVPIDRVMFWVPHPGDHLGMGISILSYCGSATLALVTDARLVPDPGAITTRFEQEFGSLLDAARAASGIRPSSPAKRPAPRRSPARRPR